MTRGRLPGSKRSVQKVCSDLLQTLKRRPLIARGSLSVCVCVCGGGYLSFSVLGTPPQEETVRGDRETAHKYPTLYNF